MLLKTIYDDSSLASLFAVINEDVSFKGIIVRITGTNGVTAATLADVGRIQYIKNGQVLVDAGYDMLNYLGDIIGGIPNRETTASGALDFFTYIPRRLFDDNVEHVSPTDNAQIKCTFGSNLATRVASAGKVEVLLDLERGVQKYDLALRQYSDSVSGAQTRPWPIEQPNIILAALSATVSGALTLTGSNISRVFTEVGGLAADASIGALQDNTTAQFGLEDITATAANLPWPYAAVLYAANGDITSRLYDSLRTVLTTSGASSPELLIASALFDNDKFVDSANKQRARLMDITHTKEIRKDAATLNALQTVANTPTA